MQSHLRRLAFVTVGIIALGAPRAARARIDFAASKNLQKAANFWFGPIESSDQRILGFDERQGVTVPSGKLEVQRLNKWDDIETLDAIGVGAKRVDSHMIYFDKASKNGERLTLEAEIAFTADIIGYVADDRLFAVSNPLFAPNPTHKKAPAPNRWSLEEAQSWTPLDEVLVLGKKKIAVKWSNQSATDPLRVFTYHDDGAPVEAPDAGAPTNDDGKPAPDAGTAPDASLGAGGASGAGGEDGTEPVDPDEAAGGTGQGGATPGSGGKGGGGGAGGSTADDQDGPEAPGAQPSPADDDGGEAASDDDERASSSGACQMAGRGPAGSAVFTLPFALVWALRRRHRASRSAAPDASS